MRNCVTSALAALLALSATMLAIPAEAHDPTLRGCRAAYERSPGHIRVYRTSCPYAIQLPRRYAISPAQNFDAWYLDRSRGGIGRYTTGCSGDYYWDGSACRRWTVAADGNPLPPLSK